ncbi:MAG TPA: winged helix-turn-helix domain-containing protein, partial [Thermoanaerobaculia bacterium]|nr:winged helix-turn-helix domain-containing protein [Thermoanaerobaculia bacterium]
MDDTARAPARYRFGLYELDTAAPRLSRRGAEVALQPQPLRLLAMLVERAGELLPREELQAGLWGDRAVEADQGLHQCVRQIREVLRDDARNPLFVETLPGRGYRFIAPVEVVEPAGVPAATVLPPEAAIASLATRAARPWFFWPLWYVLFLLGVLVAYVVWEDSRSAKPQRRPSPRVSAVGGGHTGSSRPWS